ncbi:MAG: MBL fold metallo-hydrolase [Pseudomonadota bacterium]
MSLPRLILAITTLCMALTADHALADREAIGQSVGCSADGVWLQVLGSGGPELSAGRASSGYLLWHEGVARVLVDVGGGVALRFNQAGARFEDLDLIALTHLHIDHSLDLAALLKASYFGVRRRDLPVLGPTGSRFTADLQSFVRRLLASDGAWPYLDDYLDPQRGDYAITPLTLDAESDAHWMHRFGRTRDIAVSAVAVHHGPIPAIAYRVDIGEATVVFTGDTTNRNDRIRLLAGQDTELLVAHHAITGRSGRGARGLHMPPAMIGQLAADTDPDLLVLSHRMRRTLGHELRSQQSIRRRWRGNLVFAEDLDCFAVVPRARPPGAPLPHS